MWTKICKKCKGHVLINEYSKCHLSRDGFKSICKGCYHKHSREFHQEFVQKRLREKFGKDKTVSLCECGLYYRNTIRSAGLTLRKFKCPKCSKTERGQWKEELEVKS